MRPPLPVLATILSGCTVVGIALAKVPSAPLTALALLGAAAILSEIVEEAERGRLREPVEEQPLRLVSGVHVAAGAGGGLGAAIALLAIRRPWDLLVLVPVALALNRSYVRHARLRRETL